MAQQHQPRGSYVKDEADSHHPHHSQGPAPPSHLHHPRPSSVVHPQHHQAPPAQHQHSAYSSAAHPIQPAYQPASHSASSQHAQDLPYYAAHQSPYSTPGTTSGYTSADNTSEMMAATQMPRPYPPMSYHTPQSNSPASVASPSGHDQHRGMYGQPQAPSQLQQQSMYYGQQPQYSSMPTQPAPSPYQTHAQQPHQPMASQPSMMMSHSQHQMSQHPGQHAQPGMTGSPRTKMEPHMPQLQRPPSGPLGTPQPGQNGQMPTPNGPPTPGGGVNNNAAPGPIPATTPLVVRQDNNGVQWIAFEYSRDRVKMEYTIRCDVESVHTDELSSDFKTENCVYPRACCPKDLYRGNRLQYETECNTVGWALAQLNPSLRGKRGLIQRAVDSWRNSNQDPRLRSRRVRRMAKMTNRKGVQSPHPSHMAGPGGPPGMPAPGGMGPGGAPMGKPGMGSMGGPMHHHHAHEGGAPGGDEVGDEEYMDESSHHHHHQAPTGPGSGPAGDDVRQAHVFAGYPQQYPGHSSAGSSAMPPMHHDAMGGSHNGPIAAAADGAAEDDDSPEGLFPDMPENKRRKFILVEDRKKGNRLRIRVTLEGVNTKEIPDSFRKSSAVYPQSFFPREMQSPPPDSIGSQFFQDDLCEDDKDEVEGGRGAGAPSRRNRNGTVMVSVPMSGKANTGEIAIPRTHKRTRTKQVHLNDLGYRMAWLQSRVFSGRTIFLQQALDGYRNKVKQGVEQHGQHVATAAPNYEVRRGKRRFEERLSRQERRDS